MMTGWEKWTDIKIKFARKIVSFYNLFDATQDVDKQITLVEILLDLFTNLEFQTKFLKSLFVGR